MGQFQERWHRFFEQQWGRFRRHIQGIEHTLVPQDPLVAVIRREGVITQGRYIMYFEVTLFGNNPVVLEEFGRVMNRDHEPPPHFNEALSDVVANYQYFIETRQRFHSIEEARDYWVARGATPFWHD